jgi:hypothetical protein
MVLMEVGSGVKEEEGTKRENLLYLRVPKNGSHGGWRCRLSAMISAS